MSQVANRIIKNTGWLYAKMAITMFVSLYTTRLILNGLGASDFGIYNIVGGAIAMLGFLNAAMAGATQRFMSYAEGEGNHENKKVIFNTSILLHTTLSVVAGILLLFAGYLFFQGVLNIPEDRIIASKVVYGSLVVSTMFTIMSVPYDAVINSHENMKYYAVIGVVESLLKLAVAFLCINTVFDKLVVYGILMASIPFITLTVMRIYCHRNYEECIISPRKYYDYRVMRQMTGFAGWSFLGTASSMIYNYGQGIIINHFFGTLLNAAQGITGQIVGQLQVFSANMMKAVNPALGKSAGAGDKQVLKEITIESARVSVFVYAPYILQLWLKSYPDWTLVFVRYCIVCSMFDYIANPLAQSVRSVGVIRYMTIWNGVVEVLALFVIPFLFYLQFSPVYLYKVMFLVKFSVLNIILFNAKKFCNIELVSFYKRVFFPSFLYGASFIVILFGLSQFFDYNTPIMLIFHLLSYSILSFFSLFLYLNAEEKKLVASLLKMVVNIQIFSKRIN